VRTTLTLDEDVAARLQAEARRSGRPFKVVVNDCLRAALAQQRTFKTMTPFKIAARALGGPAVGSSYDDIGAILEQSEGSRHT
jgi:predicted nucleic acid-binding protein